MEPETPTALRATAVTRVSKWLKIPFRGFSYDARYADGREEYGVQVGRALKSGQYPADAHVVRTGAEAACPPMGQGPWVDYPWGRPVGPKEP